MLKYPIEIRQKSPEEWFAYWVDFPDYGRAVGPTGQKAFDNLIDSTFNAVADVVASGRYPEPSPDNGRPVVSFGRPETIVPPHIGRLISVTRHGTFMTTYSWTNDFAYVE